MKIVLKIGLAFTSMLIALVCVALDILQLIRNVVIRVLENAVVLVFVSVGALILIMACAVVVGPGETDPLLHRLSILGLVCIILVVGCFLFTFLWGIASTIVMPFLRVLEFDVARKPLIALQQSIFDQYLSMTEHPSFLDRYGAFLVPNLLCMVVRVITTFSKLLMLAGYPASIALACWKLYTWMGIDMSEVTPDIRGWVIFVLVFSFIVAGVATAISWTVVAGILMESGQNVGEMWESVDACSVELRNRAKS